MKCTDVSSRLVDFLYEEIPPVERAEFSAHLASCPTCAAEVKASSRALQRTRTALRGPLNEEPPARVHANILAAARAAAQPAATRKPLVEEKDGFFARLWKAPWLIPAMGAAGVATAIFLIKVIKNPEVLPVREPASPTMVATPPSAQDKAPMPLAAPAEPQAEAVHKSPANIERRAAAGTKRERARSEAAPARTAPHAPALREKKKLESEPLAGFDREDAPTAQPLAAPPEVWSQSAAPSPKRATPAPAARNAPGAWAEPPPPRGLGGKDHRAEADDRLLGESASGAGASQPRGELLQARPQRAIEGPRPAPAHPAASAYALPPAPSAAPAKPAAAKAAAQPSEPRAKAKKSASLEDLSDEVAESAPLSAVSAERKADSADKKGSASKQAFEERVRKADKLYDEKRWSEAAAAYRGLLAQAPNHPSAPAWRQRLVLAERSQDGPADTKAKAKASDDALEGF